MSKGTRNLFDGAAWHGHSSWHHWSGHHKDPSVPSTPGSGGSSSGGSSSGGSTGPTATLTVTFKSEDAAYASVMGWYNARTGEAGVLFKNTNDDGWNAGVKAGDSRSLTALQSDIDANNIGFFLIPNGANELSSSTLSSSMRFEVGKNGDGRIVIDRQWGGDTVLSGNDVLFSNQVYNKGDYDYVSGTVGTAGQTRQQRLGAQSDGSDGILGTMAWDDQGMSSCGGTDRDFNDVVFTVTKSGGTNPPPPPPNKAPTDISLSNASISENVAGGVIGMLSTSDPNSGDKHTYSVSDNRFEVVDGQLKLKSGVSLDYEAGSSVELKITSKDQGGLGYSENFTVAVKNVNEAPTDISISNLSVDENASGAVIGKLSTTDPDAGNTHSYTVNDSRFEVVNGALKLVAGKSLDFETESSVQLKVTTKDQGGLSYTESFVVKVNDVNEAPANSAPTDIKLSSSSINENVAGGVVGTLTTVDPDAGNSHTYTVDDTRFEVVSGQLKLKSGVSLDYESGSSVQLKVTTTDQGGLSYSETMTVTVNNVNEAPNSLADKDSAINTVSELAAVGTAVGITAAALDPDAGDKVTYSLSNDAGGRFAVDPSTGVVTVAGGLDYETATQHTITVRATDGSGSYTESDFTIQVGDASQVAVDGYIAGATVFADKNGNGVRDAGEAFTGTDAFGRFELNSGNAPLVLAGGYDIAKGVSFQGKLSAQAGSAVVTPLTTLVVELGRAGVANPNATLAAALGMPAGTNFGQIDPIATAATSIAAFMHSNQILDTVTMVANLMVGANPTLGMERSIATVFAMLAAQAADGVLDLGDTATVEQVINGTAAALGVSGLSPSLVSDAAAVVAALDDAIDAIVAAGGTTASLLNQITAASIVAQGDASVSLKFAGQFNDGEGLVDGFTGAALTNQINAAASQVANVTGTGTVGSGADDVISGNGGVHTFAGGGGKDTLSGGAGNDLLYGDAGDDVLNGQDDEDRLTGGAGNDQLNGGLGADIYIHSGTAADGSDTVNTGDDGFDRILFNTADLDDLNFMRDGNDLVLGASHSGGPAFDGSIRVVNHYDGASIFFAEIDTSHNTDYGLDPDSARFFFTTDLANGLENDDATEVLLGGNVADVIHGNGGFRDIIDGGGGNDLITGGDIGVDNIYGGAGNDQIDAGDGDDLISGDAGNDRLTGGGGSDTFLFNLSLSGADTLTDFDKASDILSFTGVADTNANGADLSDLLALVSGITNFGAGNDVVVNFSTGASLTFQGAGVSGSLAFTDLVANPATQIRVA